MTVQASGYVVLGPPAAGKTTAMSRLLQGSPAISRFGVWDTVTGLLREGHPDFRAVQGATKGRDVFPDEMVKRALEIYLSRLTGEVSRVVIDGYPRNGRQVADLFKLCETTGLRIPNVIVFDVSDEVAARRAQFRTACLRCSTSAAGLTVCPTCGGPMSRRADDADGQFFERLRDYRQTSQEILPLLSIHADVIRVDSSQGHDQIQMRFEQIVTAPIGEEKAWSMTYSAQ